MTEIMRVGANADSIIGFLWDWAKPIPVDVSYNWITREDDGSTTTNVYTHPSFLKFMQQVGMKYNPTTKGITDLDDNPLVIDATTIQGKDLDYVKSINAIRFKMLLDTTNFLGRPNQYMMGVTGENEIYHWGHQLNNVTGHSVMTADANGLNRVPSPAEKAGAEIKGIYSAQWSVFVLYEDGDLYSIGLNTYGQLGIGNTATQMNLMKVPVGVKIVKIASASEGASQGYNAVLMLDENGEVWVQGSNTQGQLGTGDLVNVLTATKIVINGLHAGETIREIYTIGLLYASSFVITTEGRVFATGHNAQGTLGLGDTTAQNEFTEVTGLILGINIVELTVSGGSNYFNSVIARNDVGRLWSWGHGVHGELGAGGIVNVLAPQEIPTGGMNGVVTKVVSSSCHFSSYIAITSTGHGYGWGYNNYGTLGVDDTTLKITTPTQIKIVNTDGTENLGTIKEIHMGSGNISAGYQNAILITTDGKIYATGYGATGQTAQNNILNISKFTEIPLREIASKIVQVSKSGTGATYSWTILLDDGRVFGWGNNAYQQIQVNQTYVFCTIPRLTIQ